MLPKQALKMPPQEQNEIRRLIRATLSIEKSSTLVSKLIEGNYHAYEIDQIADEALKALNMAEIEVDLVTEELRNKSA